MKRTGECLRCAACCKKLVWRLFADDVSDLSKPRDYARWAGMREGVRVNDFLEAKGYIEVVIERECENLSFDGLGRSGCGIYESRPEMCRRFPVEPTDHCKGYKFTM